MASWPILPGSIRPASRSVRYGTSRHLDAAPAHTPRNSTMVGKAIMAKCDALDGLKDGQIDDTSLCAVDMKTDVPACAAGSDNDACLTAAQAATLTKIYSGPVSHGQQIFPGFMLGSEVGWMNLVVPAQADRKAADFNLAEGTMRYLVHTPPQPHLRLPQLRFRSRRPYARCHGASWPTPPISDLSALQQARRQADHHLRVEPIQISAAAWLASTITSRRSPRTVRDTPQFLRLFMVPGMSHCGVASRPIGFDAVTALCGLG